MRCWQGQRKFLMPHYRLYKKELLHIHIPKTGGASISKAVESFGGLSNFMRKSPAPQCGNVPPQHMDIEHTKRFFNLKKIKSFAIIRDPWHRTVSEFVWQFNTANFTKLNKWVRYGITGIPHYKYYNHLLPQYKFINDDVKLFKYDNFKDAVKFVGQCLEIKDFKCLFNENVRKEYEPPAISILDEEAKKTWQSLYKRDLDLYHSL